MKRTQSSRHGAEESSRTDEPQGFMMMHSHLQDHVAALARDQVKMFFEKLNEEAVMNGQPPAAIANEMVDAAIAQQIVNIMEQIGPELMPEQPVDPLVAIRQQELQNDQMEIQRKAQNDAMDFQIDQAKLTQAMQLAQQRMNVQQGIADDRNDVNVSH